MAVRVPAPRRRLGLLLVAAAAALPAPSVSVAAVQPPSLAARCDQTPLQADPFWLATADGARLYAFEAGSGPTAVVLAHQATGNLCGWLPYAATLVDAGLRVLAFDFRGFGGSAAPRGAPFAYDRDLAAAVARVRADGAQRVFLVGASLGGAVALAYGSRLELDGVVSLSGLPDLGKPDAVRAVRSLRVPLLIVGTRHDRAATVSDSLRLLHLAGSRDERTAFYPGGYHGWDIVEIAPYAASARTLLLDWLRAR